MIARTRMFQSIGEHDYQIVENINALVGKNDKLFILGDVAFSRNGLQWANNIMCRNIELILGNHDMYPIEQYQAMGWKVHGFHKYKGYWLSHCPIHPNELRDMHGNIHGHVHIFSDTPKITDPRYFNANPEFHKFYPIKFHKIEQARQDQLKQSLKEKHTNARSEKG